MKFAGIVDNSTIDYPRKVAAVVYLGGCNFRCPFCHNRDLVLGKGCKNVDINYIINQLKDNFLIQGVVITGGEPLMQEETIDLIKDLKNTDLSVKLDTNGSYPERLEKIIDMTDFLSIDIKAPLDKYGLATGLSDTGKIIENLKRSLEIIKNSTIQKEARTTIVPGINDNIEDIEKIAKIVADNGFKLYSIQQFRPANTLDSNYEAKSSPDLEKMRQLGKVAKKLLPDINVRISTLEYGFEYIV